MITPPRMAKNNDSISSPIRIVNRQAENRRRGQDHSLHTDKTAVSSTDKSHFLRGQDHSFACRQNRSPCRQNRDPPVQNAPAEKTAKTTNPPHTVNGVRGIFICFVRLQFSVLRTRHSDVSDGARIRALSRPFRPLPRADRSRGDRRRAAGSCSCNRARPFLRGSACR